MQFELEYGRSNAHVLSGNNVPYTEIEADLGDVRFLRRDDQVDAEELPMEGRIL